MYSNNLKINFGGLLYIVDKSHNCPCQSNFGNGIY